MWARRLVIFKEPSKSDGETEEQDTNVEKKGNVIEFSTTSSCYFSVTGVPTIYSDNGRLGSRAGQLLFFKLKSRLPFLRGRLKWIKTASAQLCSEDFVLLHPFGYSAAFARAQLIVFMLHDK